MSSTIVERPLLDHDEAMKNPFNADNQSAPQRDFIKTSYYKMNIQTGPVQCGKSHITNVRFCYYTIFESPHDRFLICGNTIDTVHSNVIDNGLLKMYQQILGEKNVKYSHGKFLKFKTPNGVEKSCRIVGVNNRDAVNKLKGYVAGGSLLDEISTYPKEPGQMAIARNSRNGSLIFATTNPSSKAHWVWDEFVGNKKKQRKGKVKVYWFKMGDNPTMDEDTKQMYYDLFSGVFFRRNVLGEWVAAEGAIYDKFEEEIGQSVFAHDQPPHKEYDDYYVTMDYGTGSVTTFALWGVKYTEEGPHDYHCLKEYYYDSRKEGEQRTDSQFATELWNFCKDYYFRIRTFICDPSATSFKTELNGFSPIGPDSSKYPKHPFQKRVLNGYNEVLEGIGRLQVLIQNRNMRWSDACKDSIREYQGYVWEEVNRERGEEKPLKKDDHCPDRDRYGFMTYERYFVTKAYLKKGSFAMVTTGSRFLGKGG